MKKLKVLLLSMLLSSSLYANYVDELMYSLCITSSKDTIDGVGGFQEAGEVLQATLPMLKNDPNAKKLAEAYIKLANDAKAFYKSYITACSNYKLDRIERGLDTGDEL